MANDAPPYYAKDPQQDPNASHISNTNLPPPYPPQPQPQSQRWRTGQPTATPAPNVQPGTIYVMPMNAPCHHQWSTRFGLLGILCAIFFCPLGLLCLLCDRQEVCIRCGARRTPVL
ncbi:hypothetical protein BDN70DRAFT_879836 [Pholiota conissans]|uniref:Membrane protein BRI3 n=1 Tax=Pholiota conissans TaxID=109636 RepID=A0A9P5Z2J9_9AGAR|nr:hypothetical protein BDN70DRAFT_879836 [Pholiota conissans]